MPLANSFVQPDRATEPENRFPLEVMRCDTCELVQLSVVVAPEMLFRDYVYASSASAPLIPHFTALAAELVERFAPPGALVVEIGSNDGVLLRPLRDRGARVLGIEPATKIAAIANAEGLRTWNEFFDDGVTARVLREEGPAAVVVGNNVLAHVADLPMFARSVRSLLAPGGAFVAEVPYLIDLLDRVEYDTIYHEHLAYFHLRPLWALFAAADLELFDVRHLSIHGGSIRIFVGRPGEHSLSRSVGAMLQRERSAGLHRTRAYSAFASRVDASRTALIELLRGLRAAGHRIAGWGASAKGNTLLNYCSVGTDLLDFVADSTPAKQGLLTPGMHIPVRPEGAMLELRPEFALLLAWNYADAIVARNAEYRALGGRFIHPIPLARILNP